MKCFDAPRHLYQGEDHKDRRWMSALIGIAHSPLLSVFFEIIRTTFEIIRTTPDFESIS